jgi:DNA (cytosine-5)-methyltransferase 1
VADTQFDEQRAGRGAGREDQARDERGFESSGRGAVSGLDHTISIGRDTRGQWDHGGDVGKQSATVIEDGGRAPTNGFWSDVDWLGCRDAKWRPVESGTFPLVDGAPSRVGRLRAYGNAITAQVAQGLIESYMETENA